MGKFALAKNWNNGHRYLYCVSALYLQSFQILNYGKLYLVSTDCICNFFMIFSVKKFEKLHFDLLLMSPPCQPFTRLGAKKDNDDPRTKLATIFIFVSFSVKNLKIQIFVKVALHGNDFCYIGVFCAFFFMITGYYNKNMYD